MNKAERTRKYIIEQVAPVFNKNGFQGTSVSNITEVTGLTKGSIYGNFLNKDEVALEAFWHNWQLLKEGVSEAMGKKNNAGDKLLTFLNYYKKNFQSIFDRGGCALLNTAVDSDDGNEKLHAAVKQALMSWKNTIEQIAREGNQRNELLIDDTEGFAILLIALLEGSIMLAKTIDRSDFLLKNLNYLENYVQRCIV